MMTLKNAVEILNRVQHLGHNDWFVGCLRVPGVLTFAPIYCAAYGERRIVTPNDFYLHESAAIAVAEAVLDSHPPDHP
jgi:hypothetical protein